MVRKWEMQTKSTLLIVSLALLPTFVGCKSGGEKAADQNRKTQEKVSSAGGLTPEQATMVVAKVGDRTITVGDITEQINKLSPYIRRRWAAPEKRKEFLDNLIRMELLAQEAEREGLGKNNPEVDRVVDQVMIRLMIQNDLEKELIPTSIDEETLKAEYEKEKDKYLRPAQIRASHIVVKTKAEAEKVLAALKEHPTDSRVFRDAVSAHSIDEASKTQGGDLGYFSETGERSGDEAAVDKAVAAAAWKLEKVGDMTPEPVQSGAGFEIIKLTNKRAKLERSFESVKRMIENRLLREKRREAMDKFVAELKSKAKIKIYEDNLAKFKIPEDPMSSGMGMPQGRHPSGAPRHVGSTSLPPAKAKRKVSGHAAKKAAE